MNILEKIRIARECKDLSQAQLAEKISVQHAAYGKIERGETELTVRILMKIAKALDMELADLVSVTGKTPIYIRESQAQGSIAGNQPISHFNYYYVAGDKQIEELIHQLNNQNEMIIQKDILLAQQAEQLKMLNEILATLKDKITKS